MGLKFRISRALISFTISGWADELEKIDFNEFVRTKIVKILRFIAEKIGMRK